VWQTDQGVRTATEPGSAAASSPPRYLSLVEGQAFADAYSAAFGRDPDPRLQGFIDPRTRLAYIKGNARDASTLNT
jgi:hypothetical protein